MIPAVWLRAGLFGVPAGGISVRCAGATNRVSYLKSRDMQIMALEVLIQILLTSLTLRISQGFVTELKVWFLIARVVSFTCVHYHCWFTLLLWRDFSSTTYFFTLEREILSEVKSQFSQRCQFVLFDLRKSCTCLTKIHLCSCSHSLVKLIKVEAETSFSCWYIHTILR